MKLFKIILYISLVLLITNCKQKKDIETLNWSNSRLLEIPTKVRYMQYHRGNLVNNPSFEDRKIIRFDSLNYTFNISSWKKEGFHVKYIDRTVDSLISPNEVCRDHRSFKISKIKADEFLEKGDGITSDFIKVIPGMYDLYFDIKCQNIKPYTDRYNRYLNDAIDIRLLFYDRNKLLIVPEILHPYINKRIDNSFKGISFSNFDKIDSTGWFTVKGVSGYFPFNESIIPDDAKFVKVYIGLKGTGTIWIDNVRLFYSKENLTPRERSKIYFDSLKVSTDLLIPKPHQARFIDTLNYFNPDSGLNLEPYILISPQSNNNDDIVKIIQNKLLKIFSNSKFKYDIREIKSGLSVPDNYFKNSLIISIGNTSLYKKYKQYLPINKIENIEDAYFIDFLTDTINILFIYGESSKSINYGVETAMQLFNGFKVTKAEIIDYPYFKTRALVIDNEYINPSLIKIMSKYRLNIIFKPGIPLKNHYIESSPIIYSNNIDISHLSNKKQAKILLKSNPEDITLNLKNIISLAYEHQKQINSFINKGYQVYFLSPFHSNQNIIDEIVFSKVYFDLLKNNSNTVYLSYGSHVNSQYHDDIQSYFFQSVTGNKPVYVDNFQDAKTPSFKENKYYEIYPEKVAMGNIFDPYDNMNLVDKSEEIMIQINSTDIFSIFRIATFGDFAWNPYEYNPDLSLFKFLTKEFGRETARYFYYFNDAYCGLLCTINKMATEGSSGKTLKSAENEIVMINASFEKIKNQIPHNTEIIDFLYISKIGIIEHYNRVYEKAIIDKQLKEDSTYSSIFKFSN